MNLMELYLMGNYCVATTGVVLIDKDIRKIIEPDTQLTKKTTIKYQKKYKDAQLVVIADLTGHKGYDLQKYGYQIIDRKGMQIYRRITIASVTKNKERTKENIIRTATSLDLIVQNASAPMRINEIERMHSRAEETLLDLIYPRQALLARFFPNKKA